MGRPPRFSPFACRGRDRRLRFSCYFLSFSYISIKDGSSIPRTRNVLIIIPIGMIKPKTNKSAIGIVVNAARIILAEEITPLVETQSVIRCKIFHRVFPPSNFLQRVSVHLLHELSMNFSSTFYCFYSNMNYSSQSLIFTCLILMKSLD